MFIFRFNNYKNLTSFLTQPNYCFRSVRSFDRIKQLTLGNVYMLRLRSNLLCWYHWQIQMVNFRYHNSLFSTRTIYFDRNWLWRVFLLVQHVASKILFMNKIKIWLLYFMSNTFDINVTMIWIKKKMNCNAINLTIAFTELLNNWHFYTHLVCIIHMYERSTFWKNNWFNSCFEIKKIPSEGHLGKISE